MQNLSLKEIAAATGGKIICGDENKILTDISTDSRKLGENTLFVPIKGERFDGHDFLDAAQNFISEKIPENTAGKNIIAVDDTLSAFGRIAKYYKQKYNVPTVSVVGSVGKTTTRDMIAAVLSQKGEGAAAFLCCMTPSSSADGGRMKLTAPEPPCRFRAYRKMD